MNKNAVRAQETHQRNGHRDVAAGDDGNALLHDCAGLTRPHSADVAQLAPEAQETVHALRVDGGEVCRRRVVYEQENGHLHEIGGGKNSSR